MRLLTDPSFPRTISPHPARPKRGRIAVEGARPEVSGSPDSPRNPNGGYEPDCDTMNLTGMVTSPKPAAVAQIDVGQRLSVNLDEESIVVFQIPASDEILGSFNHSEVHALIECMGRGYQYTATVLSKDDGYIRVHVRRATESA